MNTLSIKQGESFSLDGQYLEDDGITPKPLTGIMIKSQLRDKRDSFVVTLSFEVLNELAGTYRLSAPQGTLSWPVGTLFWDIKANNQLTATNTINVVQAITRI